MIRKFCLWVMCGVGLLSGADGAVGSGAVRQAADRLFANVAERGDGLPRNYVTFLFVESAFRMSEATGDGRYAEWAWDWLASRNIEPGTRLPWTAEPFENITYHLWKQSGNAAARRVFLEETQAMAESIPRTAEGVILHRHLTNPARLLIDRLQAVALRFAQAGALTGDAAWFDAAHFQYRAYRDLLRDPRNGLYSQGRGWAGPPEGMLSPGAWSRGHGWLLRGLVLSMDYLPRDSAAYAGMREILVEMAGALLAVQDPDGLWHALLDQPWADSSVETSGSGLIAGYLLRAVRRGHLPAAPYRAPAMRTAKALTAYVSEAGVVLSACPGPGPLYSIAGYYRTEFPDDEAHGRFALMTAFSEALALDEEK